MYELTKEQNDFLSQEGKVVLCACPGSGKTYVVARKLLKYIQSWNHPHKGVAVLSFTNVASLEIQKQAKDIMCEGFEIDYPHFVGTIDSFINNYILLRFGYLMMKEERKRPTIVIDGYHSIPFRFWRNECHKNGCIDNINEFHWALDGKLYRGKNEITCSYGKIKPPCVQYKSMMLKNGYIFQNETAALAYLILKKYPDIAKTIAVRFPVIIIDEAQDTSVEQSAIFDLLAEVGIQSIFLVGDPDQSIYEWRSATPECFIEKMYSPRWQTLFLSVNFRSSQLICNATQPFSHTLKGKCPSTSSGKWADFKQNPILMLYDKNVTKDDIVDKFIEISKMHDMKDSKELAILTRSRIHKDVDIKGLWKSVDIETFAKAAYEWHCGSRRKAYGLCEKALFNIVIDDIKNIERTIDFEIEKFMSYDTWKGSVIDILCILPSPSIAIGTWVTTFAGDFRQLLIKNGLSARDGINLKDLLKIKSRDKNTPQFVDIPLKHYFEIRSYTEFTFSSIHGVKGESFDAVMMLIQSTSGKTITPNFLDKGGLADELMRIAYVAMTRPRKLLVVAMPYIKSKVEYARFPKDKWEYLHIKDDDL